MKESEFLLRIRPYLYEKEGLVWSINEDCAVVPEGRAFKLLTADALVEGVHFDRRYFTPYALGFKLAAVNLSDIAAMGGLPEWALLTVGFPKPPEEDFIEAFYQGLTETLSRFGARLVGGDTVKSPAFWAALFLTGRTENPILRKGARPGDLIYVSRPLGASAAALRYFLSGKEPPDALRRAHLFPEPEIPLGRLLSEKGLASAMIDISDGLLLDLARLCEASEVGAELEEVPVAPGATEKEALSGGEDYALLFTVPEEKESILLKTVGRALYGAVRNIGTSPLPLGDPLTTSPYKGEENSPLCKGGQGGSSPSEKKGDQGELITQAIGRPLYRLGKITSQKGQIHFRGRPVDPEGFDHFNRD